MAVLKYRDPATGDWVDLAGSVGPTGPTGPTGPAGADGNTLTPAESDEVWLPLDGSGQMYGPLDAGGNTIASVAAGTVLTDAATVGQLPGPGEMSPVRAAPSAPTPRGVGDIWVDNSAPVLEWDTGWTSLVPYLTNGWVRYGDSRTPEPACRLLPGGVVELQGMISHSTITTTGIAINLPPDYRCSSGNQAEFLGMCAGGVAHIIISSTVRVHNYVAGNGSFVGLQGIRYLATA